MERSDRFRGTGQRQVDELKSADHTLEWGAVHTEVKETVAKFLYDETRRRPMVLPVRVEV